jgi:3-hydroxybutyryl-CoA dehydrogenase
MGRILATTDFAVALADADVVIEAVPEQLELKQQVFRNITDIAKPCTLLATNTSQLSITEIASATGRPEDIIGMHFFNPPILMRLIEIVPGLKTSEKTRNNAMALCDALGMEAAVCNRDTVGFITTRAAIAMRLECFRMYEEGVASIQDIDRAMRIGFNHPMGPFELNDYNGLEVGLANAESLRKAYGDRFAPPQALVARVRAGMLGRKTGQGWYDYSGEKPAPIN